MESVEADALRTEAVLLALVLVANATSHTVVGTPSDAVAVDVAETAACVVVDSTHRAHRFIYTARYRRYALGIAAHIVLL